MTLLLGLPLALLLGLTTGRPRVALPVFGAAWYVFLAIQTAHLAHVGRTGFFGVNGLDALNGPLYWGIQPVLLGAGVALALLGIRLRRRLIGREPEPA